MPKWNYERLSLLDSAHCVSYGQIAKHFQLQKIVVLLCIGSDLLIMKFCFVVWIRKECVQKCVKYALCSQISFELLTFLVTTREGGKKCALILETSSIES